MKRIMVLWMIIAVIVLLWINYLFISPRIFGKNIVEIPDIVNMDAEKGLSELEKYKIKYKIMYIENDEEKILKTIPYVGTSIKEDTYISVYIGKIYPIKYNSYIGLLYENVCDQIIELCNKTGVYLKIVYEDNSDYINGMIIKESINDGAFLEKGAELIITIAKSNSFYLMPDLVGLNIEEAINIISEYNFKVNIVYYQSPIDEDIVIYQSVEANSVIDKRNKPAIDIYVSKALELSSVINLEKFIDVIQMIGYQYEIIYIDSNENSNKFVAFKVQKLYDNNMTKYFLWITK